MTTSLKRWKRQIYNMLSSGLIEEAKTLLEPEETIKHVMHKLFASIRKNDIPTARIHFERWVTMVNTNI
jgi:hypothetical protein